MKYTPPDGSITITIATDGDHSSITVADTGPGLDVDEIPHVFERFWRGRSAVETHGSGIGLAVVAELVDAHHGTVHVANRPDGGAEFTVTLPRA